MYMKNDKELLTDFAKSRNLKQTTITVYKSYIKTYTQNQQKSFSRPHTRSRKRRRTRHSLEKSYIKKKINELQIIYL